MRNRPHDPPLNIAKHLLTVGLCPGRAALNDEPTNKVSQRRHKLMTKKPGYAVAQQEHGNRKPNYVQTEHKDSEAHEISAIFQSLARDFPNQRNGAKPGVRHRTTYDVSIPPTVKRNEVRRESLPVHTEDRCELKIEIGCQRAQRIPLEQIANTDGNRNKANAKRKLAIPEHGFALRLNSNPSVDRFRQGKSIAVYCGGL